MPAAKDPVYADLAFLRPIPADPRSGAGRSEPLTVGLLPPVALGAIEALAGSTPTTGADQDALWPDLDVIDRQAAKRQWQKAIPRGPSQYDPYQM